MRLIRAGLMVLGVLVGAYGAWLLWDRSDTEGLISAGTWLLGGVLFHDVLISAIVIGLGLLTTRVLPLAARAPSAIAVIIVGPLTLIAFPMIGGFGAKDDNPTLLDRPYLTNWVVLVAVTLIVVIAASVTRARSAAPGPTTGTSASGEPDARTEV